MKQFFETLKFLVFMLLFVKTNLALKGQDCGGIPYSQEAYVNYSNTQFSPLLNESIIYVYFVVYRNDDGTNGVGIERLYSIMERLNTSFESANFKFIWNECETSFVNNTTLNNEQGRCLFVKSHLNGLEIHVRGDTNGRAAAYSNEIPGDMVIIGGTFEINNGHSLSGVTYSTSNSIVHEVGHAFGLFHTHHGVCTGEESIRLCPTGNITVPFPDNDFVDDTPLDPNLQKKIGSGCQWNGDKCQNPDINISNPLTNNYMSYTKPSCMNSFTPGQITRMQMLCLPNVKFSSFKPLLDEGKIANFCSLNSKNLNQLLAEPLPCIEVKWSTDSDPSDGIITVDGNIANSNGTYYAYFYNSGEYSGASIPVVVECCNESPDVTISENTEITGVLSAGSYLVKSGITLTVKGRMEFNFGKGIIIEQGGKLIVDGGVLTNCPNYNSKWKGIKAWGNPFWGQTYAVELKNGAVIENAEIGINTSNIVPGGMFGTYFDLSGAKITVDHSTFKNCGIGVNFGPYGYSGSWFGWEDASSFMGTTFENCEVGVKLSRNMGVEFQNTQVKGIETQYGIEAINSKIDVTGCTFEGNTGIFFETTWPGLVGSNISNNYFLTNYEGILLDAQGNASEHFINKNFFAGSTGIMGFGQSFLTIKNNDFVDNALGVGSWYTGDDDNIISDNGFSSNEYGSTVWGRNNNEYRTNCFDNIYQANIELYDHASIFSQQGDIDFAASNCFNKYVPTILTGEGTEHFTYFVKTGTQSHSCQMPDGIGNYDLSFAFDENPSNCGSGILGGLPPSYINCVISKNHTERKKMETDLKKEIDRLIKDTSLPPSVRNYLIARYKRCLKRLIGMIVMDMMGSGTDGREQAIAYLSAQELFSHKIMAFALIAESGDLFRASAYLNTLPTRTNAELGFVEAQRIYLSSLLLRQNFVLSVTDRISLENIAKSENELSGYARTIYYLLTGQRIQVDLPHLRPVIPRTKSDSQSEATEIIKAYPNPVAGSEYFIDIPHNENTNHYVIQLSDLSGRELVNQKGNPGVNSLIIDQCASGVYILKVTKNGSKVMTQKVVRL